MGAQEQGHGPDLAHNWAVLIGPEDQPRPQAEFIFPHPESSYSSYQDRGTRDQIANINWVIEKAREFQEKKKSTSALLTILKPLTVWITTNKNSYRSKYQTTLPASWKTCMQVKKQQLEPDMEKLVQNKERST